MSQDEQIINLVKQLRQQHPRIGGRKLYQLLKPELLQKGIKLGRDAFFNLLSEHRLLIRRRRLRTVTTYSRHRFRKYPNLIRELTIERSYQVWVRDITYWFTAHTCLYVCMDTVCYSRKIMGYAVGQTLETIHCRQALEMALQYIA